MGNVKVPLASNHLGGEMRRGQPLLLETYPMKKILVLSVSALTVLAISGQNASAWSEFKFGVGLNLAYKGGGNNILWGAYKSQQPPAPGYPGYPGVDPAAVPPVMPGAFGAGYG